MEKVWQLGPEILWSSDLSKHTSCVQFRHKLLLHCNSFLEMSFLDHCISWKFGHFRGEGTKGLVKQIRVFSLISHKNILATNVLEKKKSLGKTSQRIFFEGKTFFFRIPWQELGLWVKSGEHTYSLEKAHNSKYLVCALACVNAIHKGLTFLCAFLKRLNS